MDTDRLNRWLTLGANIGVVIGIILLIIELDQNRDMMRAEIRNELSRGAVDVMSLLADKADVIARANNGEELTPAEVIIMGTTQEAIFRHWENAHYQYRQGMYDESEFSRHLAIMNNTILNLQRSLIEYWCESRMYFSAPFMEEIDKMLSGEKC